MQGKGEELGDIPQTEEEKLFATEELREDCRSGIYKEVSPRHAARARAAEAVISSAFVVWQKSGPVQKPRLVVNLSKQSKRWKKGSLKMDSIAEFASSIQKDDHPLSFNIKKRVSPLQVAPIYVALVHFSMGRTVLPMHCTPFRMGALPSMVYAAGGSIRQGIEKIRISSVSVPRRFPHRPDTSRSRV